MNNVFKLKCNEKSKNSEIIKKEVRKSFSNVYLNYLVYSLPLYLPLSFPICLAVCVFVWVCLKCFFTRYARSLKSIFKFLDLIFYVYFLRCLICCARVCVFYYLFSKITKEYKNKNNRGLLHMCDIFNWMCKLAITNKNK